MSTPFKGKINIDVRDSTPDWEPYRQPEAPDGAPNVLFIVWDDTGFGALEPLRDSAFGRYVKRNMTRVIEMVRLFGDVVTMFGAWYHDWMLIAAGFAVILGAWANGLLPSGLARR